MLRKFSQKGLGNWVCQAVDTPLAGGPAPGNIMLCYVKKKKRVVGLFRRLGPNLANSPFVAQACSGATKLAADPSIHLLQSTFFVWLDRVASSRNSIKTIDFS